MSSRNFLTELFHSNYQLNNLKNIDAESFKVEILKRLQQKSHNNFIDVAKQRGLSVQFHWGHNHHFSDDFILNGNMRDRHINIISSFSDKYLLPIDLSRKKVLDIGVWTGGTSLLLAAMGAEVYALEEVAQYSDTVNFLAFAFGIEHLVKCFPVSLYDFLPQFSDFFDIVIYSGVIYHVSDPLISLRMIFSALKNDGIVFLETYGIDSNEPICRYEGTSINLFQVGSSPALKGWNYFIPSASCLSRWCYDAGFQEVEIGLYENKRIQGFARRTHFQDFCRAGISRQNIR